MSALRLLACRCVSLSAVRHQSKATDPIQTLFIQKVAQYEQERAKSGGKLVGASADTEKALNDQLARVDAQFKVGPGGPASMLDFPKFDFKDQPVDPCGTGAAQERQVEDVDYEVKRHGWPEDKNLSVFT